MIQLATLNALILFIILDKENVLHNAYVMLANKLSRVWIIGNLLACGFCLSFWIALGEGLVNSHTFWDIVINFGATAIIYGTLRKLYG
jgi:hypothetical protein